MAIRPAACRNFVRASNTCVDHPEADEDEYRAETAGQCEQAPAHVAVDDGLCRIVRVDPDPQGIATAFYAAEKRLHVPMI